MSNHGNTSPAWTIYTRACEACGERGTDVHQGIDGNGDTAMMCEACDPDM